MKILIVDDESVVRRSLVRAGQSRGHETLEASNGEEALSVWSGFASDLVYLDVLMPGLSGPQVLKELEDKGATKVILISAYSGDYDPQTTKSLGADLFIAKPFSDIFSVIQDGEGLVNG